MTRSGVVMREYWKDPEATAQTMRGGWVHTGDVGVVDDDGFFSILDRKGDMIVSGGYNVYPREIEDVLLAHPAVREAAAVGIADDRWGERVHAVVALRFAVPPEELLAFCAERLPSRSRPRSLEFRAELPKSHAGKILRRVVRDELAASTPTGHAVTSERAPRSVVIVDAVRSPIGRRDGGLVPHPSRRPARRRAGRPARADRDRSGRVDQLVGGCVDQVGMQSSNVDRTAALVAGLPAEVPASTVTVQCGSSQQAHTVAHGLIAGAIADVVIACGVENMSMSADGSAVPAQPDVGRRRAGGYAERYEIVSQFVAADRIAAQWGDRPRGRRRVRGSVAAARRPGVGRGPLRRQIAAVAGTTLDDEGRPRRLGRRDARPRLRTNSTSPDDAVHTAGTSSQISDGAAALLLMYRGARRGARARHRWPGVAASCLVGSRSRC